MHPDTKGRYSICEQGAEVDIGEIREEMGKIDTMREMSFKSEIAQLELSDLFHSC